LNTGALNHTAPSQVDDRVRKSWFTYVDEIDRQDENQRGDESSDAGDIYDLGPSFRARAHRHLTTHQNLDPLPSTGFLVRSSIKHKVETDASLAEFFRESLLHSLRSPISNYSSSHI